MKEELNLEQKKEILNFWFYKELPLLKDPNLPAEKLKEIITYLNKDGYIPNLHDLIFDYRLKRHILVFDSGKHEINSHKFGKLQFYTIKVLYKASIKRTKKDLEEELKATEPISRFYIPSNILEKKVSVISRQRSKGADPFYKNNLRKTVIDAIKTMEKYNIPYKIKGNRKLGYRLVYKIK